MPTNRFTTFTMDSTTVISPSSNASEAPPTPVAEFKVHSIEFRPAISALTIGPRIVHLGVALESMFSGVGITGYQTVKAWSAYVADRLMCHMVLVRIKVTSTRTDQVLLSVFEGGWRNPQVLAHYTWVASSEMWMQTRVTGQPSHGWSSIRESAMSMAWGYLSPSTIDKYMRDVRRQVMSSCLPTNPPHGHEAVQGYAHCAYCESRGTGWTCGVCHNRRSCDHCHCTPCRDCGVPMQQPCSECGRCRRCCNCEVCTTCRRPLREINANDPLHPALAEAGVTRICDVCHNCLRCCRCRARHDRRRITQTAAIQFIGSDRTEFRFNPLKRFVSPEIEVCGLAESPSGYAAEERWNRYLEMLQSRQFGGNTQITSVGDSSLPSGGFELNLPPSNGDRFVELIHRICEDLHNCGAWVNHHAGLHVHVDARDFDSWSIRKVISLYRHCEPAIYAMCVPSRLNSRFCVPIGDKFSGLFKAKTKKENRDGIMCTMYGTVQRGHSLRRQKYVDFRYNAFNLHSWLYRKTVEFRMREGTLDAWDIIMWSTLLGGLVEAASTMSERDVTRIVSGVRTQFNYDAMSEPATITRSTKLLRKLVPTHDSYITHRLHAANNHEDYRLRTACPPSGLPPPLAHAEALHCISPMARRAHRGSCECPILDEHGDRIGVCDNQNAVWRANHGMFLCAEHTVARIGLLAADDMSAEEPQPTVADTTTISTFEFAVSRQMRRSEEERRRRATYSVVEPDEDADEDDDGCDYDDDE